jgi:hypothetical protein
VEQTNEKQLAGNNWFLTFRKFDKFPGSLSSRIILKEHPKRSPCSMHVNLTLKKSIAGGKLNALL